MVSVGANLSRQTATSNGQAIIRLVPNALKPPPKIPVKSVGRKFKP